MSLEHLKCQVDQSKISKKMTLAKLKGSNIKGSTATSDYTTTGHYDGPCHSSCGITNTQ